MNVAVLVTRARLSRRPLPSGPIAHLASLVALWFVVGIAAGAAWRASGLSEPPRLARSLHRLEPFGDASYATYLVHGVVLTILLRFWVAAVGAPSAWFLPVGLISATAGGWAVHILAERPLLRLLAPRASGAALPFLSRGLAE